MRSAIVYLAQNKNNKVYVGKTIDLEFRIKRHQKDSVRTKFRHYPFYRAIRKYGLSSFQFSILETYQSEEAAYEAEAWWISYFRSIGVILYNTSNGGRGACGLPQQSRLKLSRSLKKYYRNNISAKLNLKQKLLTYHKEKGKVIQRKAFHLKDPKIITKRSATRKYNKANKHLEFDNNPLD